MSEKGQQTFAVVKIERRRSVVEMWIEMDKMPELQAGDLVEVSSKDHRISSLFSIADYDADYDRKPSVKLLVSPDGRVSRELAASAVGDEFDGKIISGDMFHPSIPDSLCIATGAGVAPFLLARALGVENTLMWGVRYVEDYPLSVTMEKCMLCQSRMSDGSSVGYPIVAKMRLGRVQLYLPEVYRTDYKRIYLCGHSSMIVDMTTRLLASGYPKEQIESEVFFPR